MNATDETVWPDGWPSRLDAETHGGLQADGGVVKAVYLDGRQIHFVLELDRSEGWVRACKTDEPFGRVCSTGRDEEPPIEVLRGEIRVEFWRDAGETG